MRILSSLTIHGDDWPDFTFVSFTADLNGPLGVLTDPLTTGQQIALNNPAVPVLSTMAGLVQQQIQKPMTIVNSVVISMVGTVVTFTITKTEVTFDRGGIAAPAAPVVETTTIDIEQPEA